MARMYGRAFQVLLTIFNLGFAVMALYFIFKGGVKTPHSEHLEYKDFVTILLTALAVMIAIAALFIAAAAVWTYKEAMEIIRGIADTAARDVAASVAARVARETRAVETDPAHVAAIVGALPAQEAPDGPA
jgi:hypothetical protein